MAWACSGSSGWIKIKELGSCRACMVANFVGPERGRRHLGLRTRVPHPLSPIGEPTDQHMRGVSVGCLFFFPPENR